VRTLEECVASIEHAMHGGVYQIGLDLVAIKDGRLWRPAHASFEAFVRERLGRTAFWAYNHVRAVECFSERQLTEIGISKAVAIMRAHPRRRDALVREAPRLTKRDLEARVAEYNRIDGFEGATDRARRASRSADKKPPKLGVEEGAKPLRRALEGILAAARGGRVGEVIELTERALGRRPP
jgi:hypothetical protein